MQKSLLGKPLLMKDVFKAGDFVDIIAITKVKDGKELLKDSVLLNKEEKQPEK